MTTEDTDYDPPTSLTLEDLAAIAAGQAELRRLAVRLDVNQTDGEYPEVVYVGEPRLDPRRDGVRWSVYRTTTGVWVDDHATNERHGPSTMREAMALVRGMIEAETAALIAAIPSLRLPQLPMLAARDGMVGP